MLRLLSVFLMLSTPFMSGFSPLPTSSNQGNLPEVYVYVDTISDITAVKAETFMTTLKEKLATLNTHIEFTPIENPFQRDNPNTVARIRFEPLFDSERIIQDYTVRISAAPTKLRELSPILKNEVGISDSISSPIAIDMIYAMILLSINHCDLAVPVFQGLKIPDSDMVDQVNYNLATCYLLKGSYQESIDLYKNLLYMHGPRFLGVNLAWLYMKTGQEDAAFDLMNRAIEIAQASDEEPDVLLADRALLYNLAFRYDDAITDLNSAIELSPNDPALYTLRGQTYILLYEWDNVLADYNKALELDPNYADAYFYRGVLKYSVLQTGASLYEEALTDFQSYLQLDPNGEHAADATRYATDIQTQLNALNN